MPGGGGEATADRRPGRRLLATAALGAFLPVLAALGVLGARQHAVQRELLLARSADAAEEAARRALVDVEAAAAAAVDSATGADLGGPDALRTAIARGAAPRAIVDGRAALVAPRLPPVGPPLRGPPGLERRLAEARRLELVERDRGAAAARYRALLAELARPADRARVLLELAGTAAGQGRAGVALVAVEEVLELHRSGQGGLLPRTAYVHAQLLRLDALDALGQSARAATDARGLRRELALSAAPGELPHYRRRLEALAPGPDPATARLQAALADPAVRAALARRPRRALLGPSGPGRTALREAFGPGPERLYVVAVLPAGPEPWTAPVARLERPGLGVALVAAGAGAAAGPEPTRAGERLVRRRIAAGGPLAGWTLELEVALDPTARRATRRQGALLLGLIGLAALLLVAAVGLLLRRAAREIALARHRADFVAGVTHDLKTPLALIRVYAETLELGRDRDPAERARFARVILRETDRLNDLIDNVLALDRRAAERPRSHDLRATVTGALAAYALPADSDLRLECAVDADLPPVPHAPAAVERIVRNLVANATKFSPAGGRVDVTLAAEPDAVVLAVRDEGPGVPPEERDRVFAPFHRAEASAGSASGTGLGLAVVRQLARQHGGDAALRPGPGGRGTEAVVRFPRAGT